MTRLVGATAVPACCCKGLAGVARKGVLRAAVPFHRLVCYRYAMDRNQRCRAIVLRTYPIGEIHKGVVLLTDTSGVIHAVAHGAASARGKLRSVAELFVEGEVALYHNPVKRSIKLQDLDGPAMHYGVRENLVKYYVASLWVELVAVSYGGGGEHDGEAYELLSNALAVLDGVEEARALELSVYVLWRYLGVLGLAPVLDLCGECGRALAREQRAYWPLGGGELRCEACRETAVGGAHSTYTFTPPARAYLMRLEESVRCAQDVLRVRLQPEQSRRLHALLAAGVEQALETRLKTLESGASILYGRG